jgi:hypothetical protein
MLGAYFDASKRDSAYVVAGCLFTPRGARKFGRAWRRIFESYGGCHMTDLSNRRGAFNGISDDAQRAMVRMAVDALCEHLEFAVAYGCSEQEVAESRPLLTRTNSPYSFCLAYAIGKIAGHTHSRLDRIGYVFEHGDRMQRDVGFLFGLLNKHADGFSERFGGFAFDNKSPCSLLEASDFVAWEVGKRYSDKSRRKRASLERLERSRLLYHELLNGRDAIDRMPPEMKAGRELMEKIEAMQRSQ